MTADMRTIVDREKQNIEAFLKSHEKPFDDELKLFVQALMSFMYASAFCERTSDMNEAYFSAQRYKDQAMTIYEQIIGKPME